MTGSTIAYALRADHEADGPEPFGGGLIRLGEDRDLNIADALKTGRGRIVVASTDHVAALAAPPNPAVEPADPPSVNPPTPPPTPPLTRARPVHEPQEN